MIAATQKALANKKKQTLEDCALTWKRGDGVPSSLGPGAVHSKSKHIFKNPVIQA